MRYNLHKSYGIKMFFYTNQYLKKRKENNTISINKIFISVQKYCSTININNIQFIDQVLVIKFVLILQRVLATVMGTQINSYRKTT